MLLILAVIAGRLNALGMDQVLLKAAAGVGAQPSNWTVAWNSRVVAIVP